MSGASTVDSPGPMHGQRNRPRKRTLRGRRIGLVDAGGRKTAAGTLTLAFMNVEAYRAFDPEDPNRTRWIDEDMNRVWDTDVLDGDRASIELERAREVRPVLENIDYLLDLHSMQHLAPPLMMTGRHGKSKDLAGKIGVPERIVGDAGHASGRRMRDFGGFDDARSAKIALLIECGQHWQKAAGDLAIEATVRFLAAIGMISQDHARTFEVPPPQRSFTVVEAVTIESEAFTFAQAFSGGEILPKAGTLIGHDGDRAVYTPGRNRTTDTRIFNPLLYP